MYFYWLSLKTWKDWKEGKIDLYSGDFGNYFFKSINNKIIVFGEKRICAINLDSKSTKPKRKKLRCLDPHFAWSSKSIIHKDDKTYIVSEYLDDFGQPIAYDISDIFK